MSSRISKLFLGIISFFFLFCNFLESFQQIVNASLSTLILSLIQYGYYQETSELAIKRLCGGLDNLYGALIFYTYRIKTNHLSKTKTHRFQEVVKMCPVCER